MGPFAACLILLLCSSGCLYLHEGHTIESGNPVNSEYLRSLPQCATKFDVIKQLGAPSKIAKSRDGQETWTYDYSKQSQCTSRLLLIFKCQSDTNCTKQAQLKFDAKGVLAGNARAE
jgi:outer membrane protein assembly factor BamE (lipoprotein component of BamABCDE complex)